MEVAYSAELLGHLTVANGHAKAVSSNVAHARSSAIEATATAAEGESHFPCITPIRHNSPETYRSRLSPIFFLLGDQSQAAQQLICTTKSCLSRILTLCDKRNSEGLRLAMWVPG